MFNWLKLSQHSHSGRLRPHEHTSYIPLGVLLLVVGLALGLTGIMPGEAPTVAAVITEPLNQQHFGISPVKFAGTCPENTLVELFKNDIFAGSTACTSAGIFSIDIDLLIGQNIVIARVYDDLNQPGPDSNAVTVFYDALPTQAGPLTSLTFEGEQLLLNTDAVFRGAFPNQEFSIPIDIIGGTPPYAMNIQWGDSNNKVVSRNDNIGFNVAHTYLKSGTYQISIQASDSTGRIAFLTVAAIVNGQPSVNSTESITSTETNTLLVLWPLYVGVLAVMISFWIGEKREKYILSRHGQLLPS
jgi:hypothetical protein